MYKKLSCGAKCSCIVLGYVVSNVTALQSAYTVVASHAVLESLMSGFKASKY